MEFLREILNLHIPIDSDNWDLLSTQLIVKEVNAGEYINKANEICDFIGFVNKGAFRAFYLNDEGVETSLLLNSKSEFITDYESYITGKLSKLNIQAIEDSELILLPKKALDELYETSFYWNKFGRLVAENVYLNCKKRTEELLFLTPEKRYLKLMDEHPEFFQKYPLRYISSYLGITPQSLSRIRARLASH
ncbi:MAG: Crp/Fnr family transcriptional regulator [Saprospiraceae bacterium]